jgi:hypothetical protein
MIRAGAVNHPSKWAHSGYREIQKPPKRYAIIDVRELTSLCGFADSSDFQLAHYQWVKNALDARDTARDDHWSEAIAVGNLTFVESVKSKLRSRAIYRIVEHSDGAYALREQGEAYNDDFGGKSEPLSIKNTVYWNQNSESART